MSTTIETFTPITAGAEHVATCPSCNQWLWKIGPNSGFFGTAPLEKAGQYMASDGDTVQFDRKTPFPAPLTAHTEFDAKVLKGECPHCGESYWFVTASYPEVPINNLHRSDSGPAAFMCDESYIDIADHVDGALLGDPAVAPGWVVLRQRARWQDRDIRLDVHMVGPFPNGDSLVGKFGVASGGCGGAGGQDIWAKAAELVRTISPAAVDQVRNRA